MDDLGIVEEYLYWEVFLDSFCVDTEYICGVCDSVIRMDIETHDLFCEECGQLELEEP